MVIVDAQSALDLMMTVKYETGAERIVIDKDAVCGDFFINLPVEKTITFQFPELLCQCRLCDTVKAAHQFPKSLDFVKGHIP